LSLTDASVTAIDLLMESKPSVTPTITLDLTKEAPHSPRELVAGFVIAVRAIYKCRASLAGKPGEYQRASPALNSKLPFKPRNIIKTLATGCRPTAARRG